jgi:hypothetical protein
MAVLLSVCLAAPAFGQGNDAPRLSPEGRFLYAHDDDWDWATPLGANEPCRLSVYGRMPWSALDWMEDGLDEVRGVLIGTPPEIGKYLTMGDLNRVRNAGPKRSYEQLKHTATVFRDLLKDSKPPNLIIVMQDNGYTGKPPISTEETEAALTFVQRGGRLIILDDWTWYREFVAPFVDAKRFPKAPPPVPLKVDEKLRKEVEQLAAQLGDRLFRKREQAQAELLKLGKDIVPILEKVEPATAEQQRRLEAVLTVLRPAPALDEKAMKIDPWMADAAGRASAIHPGAQLRAITRNGNQQPGLALLIPVPAPGKGK